MGKKPTVSVTYENERISIKNSLPYLKCVLRLSCVVHWPIYGRFIGFYVKRFSLYIKVYQDWALQRSGSTDPPKKNVVFLLCQREQETVSHPACE